MATTLQAKEVAESSGGGASRRQATTVTITPPNIVTLPLTIRGTAPLVVNRMSHKALQQMKAAQEAGSVAKKGKKREPKDFAANYEGARHVSTDGWDGVHAGAFRSAMISACRTVGFQMTRAKLSVFVEADGFDKVDGVPLVKITKGKPHYCEHLVRNDSGVVDIRARAMFDQGWEMVVKIKYDADQFTASDVVNLMARVGMQVGICEGRPDSKDSAGVGWGLFEIINQED